MYKYCWIIMLPFQMISLFSQDQLNEKEKFFLSQQNISSKIVPLDNKIGPMEDNKQLIQVIEDFILKGPEQNNSIESMISLLKEKYPVEENKGPTIIRISKNEILNDRYESDIRLFYENNSLLCTIYLRKVMNKWYIEDFDFN